MDPGEDTNVRVGFRAWYRNNFERRGVCCTADAVFRPTITASASQTRIGGLRAQKRGYKGQSPPGTSARTSRCGPTPAQSIRLLPSLLHKFVRLPQDRKSTRLNSSHLVISYAV